MKKHELLKYAYDNYPNGTKFNALRTSDVKVSDGDLNLIKEFGDIIILSDSNILYEAGCWAKVVKPSILDGKALIVVENYRQFTLLNTYLGLNLSTPSTYPVYYDADKKYGSYSYTTKQKLISFAGFAKEIGIKVPKFIIKSEDGVDLYEGDDLYTAKLCNGEWVYDDYHGQPYNISKNSLVVREQDEYKAFSTREAAEKWIAEMNKPKDIELDINAYGSALIKPSEVVFNGYVNRITGAQIESIYKAYQSLQ